MTLIQVSVQGQDIQKMEISPNASTTEVMNAFWSLANIGDGEKEHHILKLYRSDGTIIPIGPHLPAADNPYTLRLKKVATIDQTPSAVEAVESIKIGKNVLEELSDLKKNLSAVKFKIDQMTDFNNAYLSQEIMEEVKKTTFDVWKFKENELIYILIEIFKDLGLLQTFNIDIPTLVKFLAMVKRTYNPNPFHNFRHCFCVTQMMYAIINVTGVRDKLTPLDLLVLVVSCIGHDLDHPGTNNAYQVNAMTELSILYNDSSPLENHHAAMLFTILKKPEVNILHGLSAADFKEARKLIITCILSTDMAKHGEIIAKFKSSIDTFNLEDPNHKCSLMQMIIKCSDISNEVRPNSVADAWVDNLLEEFFCQSDKEKAEGLPTAPFMDRQKVTKPGAQVGFIGFVMIPLFETLSKVLPNMEDTIIKPIKDAQKHYQALVDKSKTVSNS